MTLELIRRKESMALSGVSCEELQFDPRFCEVPLWFQGNGQRETVGVGARDATTAGRGADGEVRAPAGESRLTDNS